jgi:hypothetical protein
MRIGIHSLLCFPETHERGWFPEEEALGITGNGSISSF